MNEQMDEWCIDALMNWYIDVWMKGANVGMSGKVMSGWTELMSEWASH